MNLNESLSHFSFVLVALVISAKHMDSLRLPSHLSLRHTSAALPELGRVAGGSDQSCFVTAAPSEAKCKKSFAPATVMG